MDLADLKKVSKVTKKTVSKPLMITAMGKAFDITNPKEDSITVEDIALALSNECRWGGHAGFYSVAQHSTLVAACLPVKYLLNGLFHDAAEAFLKDLPTPLKALLPYYVKLEKRFEKAIFSKFGVTWTPEAKAMVKAADKLIGNTEGHHFFPGVLPWTPRLNLPNGLAKSSPRIAEKVFIDYFDYSNSQTKKDTPNDYILANDLEIIF